MLRTLYARLAAALVAIFLVIGLLYGLITSVVTERYLQQLNQQFNSDLAQRIVADRKLVAAGELDRQALKTTFSAYMDINPSIEIYLIDSAGKILAFSADPGRVKRQHVDLQPIRAFLRGEGFPLLGDDPRSHDRRKAFSVTPVPAGYLYVVLRGEEYDSVEQTLRESYLIRLSLWTVLGSLGFGLLAGLLLFHRLTRRLQRLSGVMQQFQGSDFTRHQPFAEDPVKLNDEIGRLGQTFDGMADRIIDQWGELKQQDRLRRELVAQISHDLRTPLAALQGYLETLQMKAETLQEGERQEYLGIALRQSRRLTRMVEALFELAQLEARETRAELEPVALAELVQDVMQKFILSADEKGIQLSMEPPVGLSLVLADLALSERLLDNLISNAIDHTPQGGTIRIRFQQSADSVAVAIEDSGPGIAAADLPHIFDPFYRSRPATGQTGHAGLGLAIARRIVDLQGGCLTAENRPDGGACFLFTLGSASV